ncbi:MAG: sigma-70 family RNA polymerase sigma factor [Planctomycetales bacterium]|nr:sigma-70 family RNA polymerase sigma factor [Planctomycetales bacterium]
MEDESKLVSDAINGDRIALQQLLLEHASLVKQHITTKIPVAVQGLIDADDVMQQACVEAFRSIRHFQPQSDGAFLAWFKSIALHRLKDAVKSLRRVKRGGEFRRVMQPSTTESHALIGLVELLSAGSHTPSRSAVRNEAVHAIQRSIQELPDDYRQAVQLRLIEGKSLDETAETMDRSPRAVRILVERAKKKMRAALGRLSLYE